MHQKYGLSFNSLIKALLVIKIKIYLEIFEENSGRVYAIEIRKKLKIRIFSLRIIRIEYSISFINIKNEIGLQFVIRFRDKLA